MSSRTSVVVIGGGVIGTACAHYLMKTGWEVTVIDRGRFGQGCSHANCGLICPSHVLPLAEPGAVGLAIKSLFRRNSPFSIKPRLDIRLWVWLVKFALRCNRRDMLQSGKAIQGLLDSSRSLYEQLMKTEPLDCEWETRGLLYVFRERKEMHHYAETDRLLREQFSCAATRYEGERVAELEPALKSGLAGGWHYEGDAQVRPDRLMSSWRQVLELGGVTIRENCEVRSFVRERGQARAILTSQGELAGDAFVVATGAWTPLLSRQLGCRIPIQPGKGYSITMPRPAMCPRMPLIFPETKVAVTPMHTGYRLGSTMEFAGYDTTLNRDRLQLLRDGAAPYMQEPYCEPVLEEWYGWRPMTYDSKPIIDHCPTMSNVLVAAGHNMLGMSMAPATGKLIAEILGGETPHVDPTPYALKRF